MSDSLMKPIRRVVTGNDANGKSTVTWDGPSPYSHPAPMGQGRGHTDLWVWTESPAPLAKIRIATTKLQK